MVKIFADGADFDSIMKLNKNPLIEGFTTNPTLLAKAGIKDYREFAKSLLSKIKDKPVSFEVIADDFKEMERQAFEIASWGENVFVKIPITNSLGESSYHLVERLSISGIKLNVTAITTIKQVLHILPAFVIGIESYISVFAGRIADTGIDPKHIVIDSVNMAHQHSYSLQVIWASPREALNIYQADRCGCDIITCTPDLIDKYQKLADKDLTEFSLDTVRMFLRDAQKSGLTL